MKFKNNIAQILNYLRDKLSPQERHALEKEALDDPFLSDAMDGFTSFDPSVLEADLQDLQNKLEDRTSETKSRTFIPWFRIAAGILLLIGAGFAILKVVQEDPSIATKQSLSKSKKESVTASSDSLSSDSLKQVIATQITEDSLAEIIALKNVEDSIKANLIAEQLMAARKKENAIKTTIKQNLDSIFQSSDGLLAKTDIEIETVEGGGDSGGGGVFMQEEIKDDIAASPSIEEENKALSRSEISTNVIADAEITGTIYDENNTPLPGVNIVIKGTNQGVVTDMDGKFKINTLPEDSLTINYIGYIPETLTGEELAINDGAVNLKEDIQSLEEVVVIGYAAQMKKELTLNTTDNLQDALEGQIAGVNITKTKNNTLDDIQIKGPSLATIESEKSSRSRKKKDNFFNTAPSTDLEKLNSYVLKKKKIDKEGLLAIELEFFVEKNGKLSEIKVLSETTPEIEEEVKRLLLQGPKWDAAIRDGEKVREKTRTVVRL